MDSGFPLVAGDQGGKGRAKNLSGNRGSALDCYPLLTLTAATASRRARPRDLIILDLAEADRGPAIHLISEVEARARHEDGRAIEVARHR